jgi:hypothetical protein
MTKKKKKNPINSWFLQKHFHSSLSHFNQMKLEPLTWRICKTRSVSPV